MLARHLVHRPQHRLVADAALAQRQHELHALFALVSGQARTLYLTETVSRELRQERQVGEIETQRRDRDAVVGKRGEIGAVLAGRLHAARIGDPVVRIAAAVVARVDVQQAAHRACPGSTTEMPFTAPGAQSGKLTLTSTSRGMPSAEHALDDVGRVLGRGLPIRLLLVGRGVAPATARTTECRARRPPWPRRWCRNRARPRRRCGRG